MVTNSVVKVPVWDAFIRVGHWLLVVGFFVAYLMEDELAIHVWAGYVVGTIVVLRVIWGFVGPEHARFSNFLYSPAKILGYLGGLLRHSSARYLGHSPAGGAMVLALLLSLAATVWSGLTVYAYDQGAGPLAGVLVGETRVRALSSSANEEQEVEALPASAPAARPVENAFEAREEYWEEVHELFANFTVVLVILHIAGVLLASFVHRENLPWAMVTGAKRPPDDERV